MQYGRTRSASSAEKIPGYDQRPRQLGRKTCTKGGSVLLRGSDNQCRCCGGALTHSCSLFSSSSQQSLFRLRPWTAFFALRLHDEGFRVVIYAGMLLAHCLNPVLNTYCTPALNPLSTKLWATMYPLFCKAHFHQSTHTWNAQSFTMSTWRVSLISLLCRRCARIGSSQHSTTHVIGALPLPSFGLSLSTTPSLQQQLPRLTR